MKQVLLWLLGVGAVIVIALRFDFAEMWVVVSTIHPAVIVGLLLLQTATLAFSAFQIFALLLQSAPTLRFTRIYPLFLAGHFVESVTPSLKFGGEAVKVYLFRRVSGLSYAQVTGAMVAGKYISLVPFLVIAGAVLVYGALGRSIPLVVYAGAAAVGLGLAAVYAGARWLQRQEVDSTDRLGSSLLGRGRVFLQRALEELPSLAESPLSRPLFGLAALVWVLYPIKVWLVAQALNLPIDIASVALATYSAYVVGLVPVFPGSLGTYEFSMAFLLNRFGLNPSEALAVTLTARFVTFWFPLVLSGVATVPLLAEFRKRKVME